MVVSNNTGCLRIASITGRDYLSAHRQIESATSLADAIELRLDHWQTLEIATIARLRQEINLPVILTLRKQSQGGHCQLAEAQRLSIIEALAALAPEYIDLEYDVPRPWLDEFRRRFPHIHIIGSYHNFNETPDNLINLLQAVQHPAFAIIKIATFARSICDTLRLLIFLREASRERQMIGIAMGEFGQISRILAPVAGGVGTYGCVEADLAAAPGQLSLSELTEIYRVPQLNRDTAIYALLGDPISQSPGHLLHNQAFSLLHKNAVYVKCLVPAGELAQAMSLLRQLPFYGLSITIPHKETIVAFLDQLFADAAIMRIVNTVKRENDGYQGFNTDAAGAVSVLAAVISLKNQRCLILGAGGSAKALAYALLAQNAEVTLCNRTLLRAVEFTKKFGGKSIDFNSLFTNAEFRYNIVINTLPANAYLQQCANWQIPGEHPGIAMDIVLKPLETAFIQSAKSAGWRCITGDALFMAQAQRQLKIWFNGDLAQSGD